ncbi:MAG: type II secretion system minor pseudopilin GspI [bacterium]
MNRYDNSIAGFTLLEVMVALAVAAIGLGAISKSMISNVDVADRLTQRSLGTWVASNRMAELRMYRQFSSAGGQSVEVEMGGVEWRIEEEYSTTADPNISRVDIAVFAGSDDRNAASLTGYLARYKPSDQPVQ